MRRITVSLPEHLAAAIADEAERRGTSVSDLVRQAVAERFGRADEPRPLGFVGLGRSDYRTTARDAEEILAAEWGRARHRS